MNSELINEELNTSELFSTHHTNITRVEIIDKNGRSYTNLKVSDLFLSYQDEGRTLKLFIAEDYEA